MEWVALPPLSADQVSDAETLRLYWQVQLERNAQLEEQRLSVSIFVVAGSVVAIGIFASQTVSTRSTMWLVASAIVRVNVFALIYSIRSEQWARFHKERARRLADENWPYFPELSVGRHRAHG
jgi:hypothetical protein